ncbi:uridine kinase, partial [Auraticoccus sp. F435]
MTAGRPLVRLDDFYRDGDEPDLPHALGIVDWDHVDSWHLERAVEALVSLCRTGAATLPVYDIAANAVVAQRTLVLPDAGCVVAEGVFAADVLAPARAAGLDVHPVWLDRPRTLTFLLRLVRDLREHRKPPAILLRRGLALWRTEPAMRARALRLGFRPLRMRAA